MNFFPIPYPDEVLSSVLARYSIRSGNIKVIHTLEDLFGTRSAIAVMEFPTRLDELIRNMPFGTKYTAEYFIYNHTLFPYYAAFITKERAELIISTMKSGEGDIYIRIGAVTSQISLNQYYRFCPECVKEDMALYGELYWHRVHQAVGVFACTKHNVPVYNSKILVRGHNRQRFQPALIDNCKIDSPIMYSNDIMDKLLLLSQDAEMLLNNNFGFYPLSWFKNQYRDKLIEKCYAKLNNMIHQRRLSRDLLEFYGEEFLELVQCKVPIKSECYWLNDMVRDNENSSHVIRHLILARFLGISVFDIFNDQLLIQSLKDDKEIFNIELKIYLESNKEGYIQVWEEKLKELISKELSLRQIAKELNSTPRTIKKHIERLGIKPFWKYNGGKRYGDRIYKDTEDFKNMQDSSRNRWIGLIKQNPSKSLNELKKIEPALGTWLTRNDKEWMKANSPCIRSNHKPVDWVKRDEELLPKIMKIVEEMKTGKPERICWTTIGSKLGISGWLGKKKEKLPLCKAYIDSVEQSVQDFQIRKVMWAADKIKSQGEKVTYWKLIEIAGVKQRYFDSIKIDIREILEENGLYGKLNNQ